MQIEVICRLVEQQYVRVFKNKAREVDARFFTAGKAGEQLAAHRGRYIQTVCHAVSVDLHVIAAETAEILAHTVVLLQQRRRLVGLHHLRQLIHSAAETVEMPVRVAQHVLCRPVLGIDRDLGYEAETLARSDHDLALVAADLAHEYAEECGLAAAVVAEYAHALPGVDGEAEPVEYIFAELEGFYQRVYGYIYHNDPPCGFIGNAA